MEIDKLTMTEKLLIVRNMNERGELVVMMPCVGDDEIAIIHDELSVNFNTDKNRVVVQI